MTKPKRKSNTSFVLTVCLMAVLIVSLMVPTALAWFTDTATGDSSTNINFGKVDIGVNIPEEDEPGALTNANSNERNLQRILPGDVLTATVELYNNGNVDVYAKANIGVTITYDGEDITNKLTDYITTSANFSQTSTIDGSEVFTLLTTQNKDNAISIPVSINISNTLPNKVDGYDFNGHTATINAIITVNIASIQKDNYTYTNVSTLDAELTALLPTQTTTEQNYNFVVNNGSAELYFGSNIIETTDAEDISINGDGKVYAFKTTNKEIIVAGTGETKSYTEYGGPDIFSGYDVLMIRFLDGVTSIGDHLISSSLDGVVTIVPKSVTTIGQIDSYLVFFMEHSNNSEYSYTESEYTDHRFYHYSEIEKEDSWHYAEDGKTPVLHNQLLLVIQNLEHLGYGGIVYVHFSNGNTVSDVGFGRGSSVVEIPATAESFYIEFLDHSQDFKSYTSETLYVNNVSTVYLDYDGSQLFVKTTN